MNNRNTVSRFSGFEDESLPEKPSFTFTQLYIFGDGGNRVLSRVNVAQI